jgi:hypothetical protein
MSKIIAETPWPGLRLQVWDDGELTYDDSDHVSSRMQASDAYEWLGSVLPSPKAKDEQQAARQQRWDAVYGAAVVRMVFDTIQAKVDSGTPQADTVSDAEMRNITAAARSVANAAAQVDP